MSALLALKQARSSLSQQQKARLEELEKKTKSELTDMLNARGLSANGAKKEELAHRVLDHDAVGELNWEVIEPGSVSSRFDDINEHFPTQPILDGSSGPNASEFSDTSELGVYLRLMVLPEELKKEPQYADCNDMIDVLVKFSNMRAAKSAEVIAQQAPVNKRGQRRKGAIVALSF